MPNEEMLRIERDAMRLILSCCGGVAGDQCNEGAGQILMQSLTDGKPNGSEETGMCLNLMHVRDLGRAFHEMMIRILADNMSKKQLPHYRHEILLIERRLEKMREGLAVREGLVALDEETPDGAGS